MNIKEKNRMKSACKKKMTDLIESTNPEFRHIVLVRLCNDCNNYIKAGLRDERRLYAGNPKEQILIMKMLWKSFPENARLKDVTWSSIIKYEKAISGSKGVSQEMLNSSDRLRYQLMDRLVTQIENYTGYFSKYSGSDVRGQEEEYISLLKALYLSFDDNHKPEWISWDGIIVKEKKLIIKQCEKRIELVENMIMLRNPGESVDYGPVY